MPAAESSLDQWFARRHVFVLAAILLASVSIRIAHYHAYSDSPGARQHLWGETDMAFYHGWASGIAAGDWLTDRALHPYHGWQRGIAQVYLQAHPQQEAELREAAPGQGPDAQAEALWNRWYGGKQFHAEPLYPYTVGLTYWLVGPDVRWAFLWQTVLGIATNVILYLLTRRYFGATAGVVAAAAAVLCAPLLFYELVLLKATSLAFVGILLVWLTGRALERGRSGAWFLLGLCFGVAFLLKSTFAVLFLFWTGSLIALHRGRPRRAVWVACLLFAGFALCLIPLAARNVAVGVPVLAATSGGAINFLSSNAADTVGRTTMSTGSKYAPDILGRTGGAMLPSIIATLETHDSALVYLQHLGSRFMGLWHWYEIPNNTNFYFYRGDSWVLSQLPMTFWAIWPLAAIGMILALGRLRDCWPLVVLILSQVAVLTLFGVSSRLRVPLLVALIPFFGFAVARLLEWIRARELRPAALTLGVAGALYLASGSSPPEAGATLRVIDHGIVIRVHLRPQAEAAAAAGDWAEAAQIMARSQRYEPSFAEADGSGDPSTGQQRTLAGMYAHVHRERAQYLHKAGRPEAARRQLQRANELARLGTLRKAAARFAPKSR